MKNKFHQSILRAYDIRGIVSETLHVKDAYSLGKKFTNDIFDKYGSARIVVGYDGRLSSPILEKELVSGLRDAGGTIIRIGLCPTPMLYFASKTLDCDGAIMITGSHNPANYNGFKILSKHQSYYGKEIKNLANKKENPLSGKKGKINNFSIKDLYLKVLTDNLEVISPKISIVWDPANGAAVDVIKSLIRLIPGKHYILNDKIDGTFPAHHPDPTEEKNLTLLKKTVKKLKADLGIAFDGDGDRIGVVDKNLKFIPGDQLLLIFAKDILKKHKGAKIIFDVKASDLIIKEIKKMGGIPLMWKTGHSLIKSKMKETGSLLAGEMSGHIFFADKYYGYDDAVYAALRLLEIYSKNKSFKKDLDVFSNVLSTPEIKIFCNDDLKFSIIEKCKLIVKKKYNNYSFIDGVRVINRNGWWLIRASNTQPAIVVRCESYSRQKFTVILNEVENILSLVGITAKLKT